MPTYRTTRPLADRLWEKVIKEPGGCWVWTGATNAAGYGKIGRGPRSATPQNDYTHRVAYELTYGAIPDGLVIDHLCRNTSCCNPDHLEAVPPRTNSLRGIAPNVVAHNEGRCINGHLLTPDNVWHINESRRGMVVRCRQCRLEANKRLRDKTPKRPKVHRDLSGSNNNNARLTEQDVREIRILASSGSSLAELAQQFHVSKANISRISHRKAWKHVA